MQWLTALIERAELLATLNYRKLNGPQADSCRMLKFVCPIHRMRQCRGYHPSIKGDGCEH